jgi:hypothetical protein
MEQSFGGTGFQPVPAQAKACGYIFFSPTGNFHCLKENRQEWIVRHAEIDH